MYIRRDCVCHKNPTPHCDSWSFNAHHFPRTPKLHEPRPQGALATARATVRRLAGLELGGLLASHRAWWHAYWPSHHISLPDTVLEQYYILQFYKLASATRCDGPENCAGPPVGYRSVLPAVWSIGGD